eukprot:GHVR01076488.1.p1 GENE.GHVR01076488.1~~GHVR01076488.1.p1  ORF type:complete len:282 (+),score=31.08 GHVR01076488.1:317-1162(+)
MMKVIDPNFDINNLAGGSTGLFKSLRAGTNRTETTPTKTLSPLLNYTGEGEYPVLFVVIYDTTEVEPPCDAMGCKLFVCLTFPPPPGCDTTNTCLFISLISGIKLYENTQEIGRFLAVELFNGCPSLSDLSAYTISIGNNPEYPLPLLRDPMAKGDYYIMSSTEDYFDNFFEACFQPLCANCYRIDSNVPYMNFLLSPTTNFPVVLKKNGTIVDIFVNTDVLTNSYVRRQVQTTPTGTFEPSHWQIPGRVSLYYANWEDAPGGCPGAEFTGILTTYTCSTL